MKSYEIKVYNVSIINWFTKVENKIEKRKERT